MVKGPTRREKVLYAAVTKGGGVASPAALAGTVNDYDAGHLAPSGVRVVLINMGGAARQMNGLLRGAPGQELILVNSSQTATQDLTLTHANAGSAVANRFSCPNAASLVLRAGGAARLVYDDANTRWQVTGI